MEKLIAKLKQIANENPNGFTVYVPSLEPVKSGYIVAVKETQNSFGDKGLKKALRFALENTGVFGGWKEKNKYYWDASVVLHDREEAIKLGRENGQIAIFDLNKLETIYL